MVILIDADGVLENLTEEMLAYINERYGTAVKFEDIREWDLGKAFPTLTREQVYETELEENLYPRLKPIEGAPEYVKRLIEDGHEVYVVTNTPYRAVVPKMEMVIKEYYPFLKWENFIITSNKQMIKGDILIDDGIHNLIGGDYKGILFDAPYNAQFDAESNGMIRAGNWKEIYGIINDMQD